MPSKNQDASIKMVFVQNVILPSNLQETTNVLLKVVNNTKREDALIVMNLIFSQKSDHAPMRIAMKLETKDVLNALKVMQFNKVDSVTKLTHTVEPMISMEFVSNVKKDITCLTINVYKKALDAIMLMEDVPHVELHLSITLFRNHVR